MPPKKHKPDEIIGKLREVEIVLDQGGTTAQGCRRIGVTEQTYFNQGRRCQQFDSMPVVHSVRGESPV